MPTPTPPSRRLTFAVTTLLLVTGLTCARHDDAGSHEEDAPVQGKETADAPTAIRALPLGSPTHRYESVAGWCQLPEGTAIGSTHGGIVLDAAGQIYFNTDTERAIMVYRPDGVFVRALAPDFPAIHGMQIREEEGEEFIYVAHLGGQRVAKLRLDGTPVWTMGVPAESGKYDDDPGAYRPTAIAVAPDGRFFVADGYGRHWVHRYAADRTYLGSFGGHGEEPGMFRTCHGLAIDTRGEEPRLVVCDRENRRLQRFDLDGNFIDIAATGLRRPCAVSFWKDLTAVAELEGRVTLLGPDMTPVAHLGDNPDENQWARHGVPVEAWKDGVFTAPHGVAFDGEGNLYVMDWNAAGRMSKLVRQDARAGEE